MINLYDTHSLSCPVCNYTLFGDEPVIEIICNNCRKEKDNESSKR